MAEKDPPAAKVDVSGRPGRRRKGRKGKFNPKAAGKGKGKPRPKGGVRNPDVGTVSGVVQQSQPAPLDQAATKIANKERPDQAFQDDQPSLVPSPENVFAANSSRTEAGRSAPVFAGSPFTSPRQSYAAIDLGTNNCRLLIARPSGENFTVIDAFSRVVRLGEGLAQSSRLSEAAMDRTLSALRVCADKLMRRNVFLARSVATEACRRAVNGPEFIDRVRQETGIALDIISAHEEARLAVLGCHVLLEDGIGPAMIFDIGGGSTELVLIESTGTVPRILDWQSVPWGVVSLTESCGPEGSTHEERQARYQQMYNLVAESFAEFSARVAPARESAVQGGPLRLLGTSGTVTTLASLHLELPHYDRRMVDGLIVPADAMRDISTRLSVMAWEDRIRLACIGRERADLVVAGCAILEAILDLWPAARLGVADRGIREGILRSLIASNSRGLRRMPEIDADTEVVRNAMGAR